MKSLIARKRLAQQGHFKRRQFLKPHIHRTLVNGSYFWVIRDGWCLAIGPTIEAAQAHFIAYEPTSRRKAK